MLWSLWWVQEYQIYPRLPPPLNYNPLFADKSAFLLIKNCPILICVKLLCVKIHLILIQTKPKIKYEFLSLNKSQNLWMASIPCRGESGAGKTENTKKVITYFASIAASGFKQKFSGGVSHSRICHQLFNFQNENLIEFIHPNKNHYILSLKYPKLKAKAPPKRSQFLAIPK